MTDLRTGTCPSSIPWWIASLSEAFLLWAGAAWHILPVATCPVTQLQRIPLKASLIPTNGTPERTKGHLRWSVGTTRCVRSRYLESALAAHSLVWPFSSIQAPGYLERLVSSHASAVLKKHTTGIELQLRSGACSHPEQTFR